MTKYPAIPPKFLDGDSPILNQNGKEIAKLVDFWSWAYSDLIGNTERGILAEYIVACALKIQNKEHILWNKYDLLLDDIKIEVKTSGYIQTWDQEKLSKLSFGIQPTKGWESTSNQFDKIKMRQSDVYVFCVHKHTEQDTINPLEIAQWAFYILPTKVLDEKVGEQKSISLDRLLKLGAIKCEYEQLLGQIKSVVSK